MINVKLVCVGNLKESFWKDAVGEYSKRLSKFCKLKIVELTEKNKFSDIERIKEEEGKEILANLEGKPFLLDIGGKLLSSEDFATKFLIFLQIAALF